MKSGYKEKAIYTELVATHITTGEVLKFKHVPDFASFLGVPQMDVLRALQSETKRIKAYYISYRAPYFN